MLAINLWDWVGLYLGGVRNGARLTLQIRMMTIDAPGTRLSEARDSGLPREFSHESCQMSGTAAGRHVVKMFFFALSSLCYQLLRLTIIIWTKVISKFGHLLMKTLGLRVE